MNQASSTKKFELAAKIRDQIDYINNLARISPSPELKLPQLQTDINQEKVNRLRQLLRQFLSLPENYLLSRIEGYDVSNISGTFATGSMVVFTNAQPIPSSYRMFKIKKISRPNDTAMLKQTLTRRLKNKDWPLPNLIIVDGGKSQLNAAHSAIKGTIPTMSLAKNPDRLIIKSLNHHSSKKYYLVKLPPTNPATQLLQHIRDESHRFAKNYHKKLKLKSLKV